MTRAAIVVLLVGSVSGGMLGTPRLATAGSFDLSWDTCSPIVTNKAPSGPGFLVLTVSTLGQTDPHTGYEFRILFDTPLGDALPDAWRFDIWGCPGPTFLAVETASLPVTCPQFQGSPAMVQAGMDLVLPEPPGGPATFVLNVSSRYPLANPPAGGARRGLARIIFKHIFSVVGESDPGVNCGGFERSVCLSVDPGSARWFDAAGSPVTFGSGQSWVTFRSECHPVPADVSTWGSIKGQYRR